MELKRQKLEQDVRNGKLVEKLKQIEIDKATGKLIDVSDIVASMRGFHEQIRSTLEFQMMETLPNLVEGKSALECRQILERVFDEIMGRIRAYEERVGKQQ